MADAFAHLNDDSLSHGERRDGLHSSVFTWKQTEVSEYNSKRRHAFE